MAVPRIWEKFEERIRETASKKGKLAQRIGMWAKSIGAQATKNGLKGQSMPIGYWLANKIVFSNLKKALGLDKSQMNIYGAAPLKQSTR